MKSVNYGVIARILRETKPDRNTDPVRYETWLKIVVEIAKELDSRQLKGFNTDVFMYKAGVEQ